MATAKINVSMPIIGLSTGKPGEFIDKRSTPDCKNVEFSRFTISKRVGELPLGDSANQRILALGELERATTRYIFRIGTTKFEEYTAGAWTSRANAALTGSESEVVDYTFPLLSSQKILVYTNGIDAIRKWTGTGNDANLGGTPPIAKYVLAFGPYLVLAYVYDSGNPRESRVQWCDTGLIETWAGGNAGFVDLIDDQQNITGLALYSDGITVHKDNCIYVGYLVTTSEVFRFDRRNTGVGAVAAATIKNLPDGRQIFLARDGIHVFNGVTAPLLDADIMDDIREMANPQYIYKATAKLVPEKDEYWVALPQGAQTEPETVYKYNYRTGQVHRDERSGLTTFGAFQATDQITIDEISTAIDAYPYRFDDVVNLALAPTVSFGHSDGTVTKRGGVFNDNDVAIDGYWVSKDFTGEDYGLEDPGILIRWNGMEVWAKGTAVTVSYSTDGGTSWTTIKALTLSGDYPSDSAPARLYFDVVSSKIRFRFQNTADNSYFALKQFIPRGTMREARQ